MNKKKPILLVIHTPPPYGGGEVQALNLKDYFSKKDNYVIYDYSYKSKKRSDWNNIKWKVVLNGLLWIIKVHVLILRKRPKKIYFTLPKSFGAFLRNASIIPFAKLNRVQILGELPGTSFLFLENKNTIKYKIGLFFLRRIDQIRFLSPTIQKFHEKEYGIKNSLVICNGIESPTLVVNKNEVFNKPTLQLIYVGSLEFSKGIMNTIKAINICINNNIDVHLNLVGQWCYQNEKSQVLKFINENKLDSYITFHGTLINNAKWNIFKSSAILVHPTFWDGVPLTILEALAIGLTIISTEIGGIPDTIKNQENGIILENNTPKNIYEAIKLYYYNRELLKKTSDKNMNLFKDKYNLSLFLKKMENWFENEH